MNEAEEILNTYINIFGDTKTSAIAAIRYAQIKTRIRAWNKALKAAAEHAKVKFIHDPDNFKTGGYYVVDQDSILKLKK